MVLLFIVVIVTDEKRIIIFFRKLNVKQFSDLNFVACAISKGDRPLAISSVAAVAEFNCIGLYFVCVRVSTS